MRPCYTPISMSSPDDRSARRALRTIRSTWVSLGLDVGRFDQRPPFLDLGLLMRGQRFCGLLLRWRNFLTEVSEPLAYRWVDERVHCGDRELADCFGRSAFRHPQSIPSRNIHTRRTGLVDRGYVGRRSQPLVPGHGVGFDPAVAHMRQSRDVLFECEIDVAGPNVPQNSDGARPSKSE